MGHPELTPLTSACPLHRHPSELNAPFVASLLDDIEVSDSRVRSFSLEEAKGRNEDIEASRVGMSFGAFKKKIRNLWVDLHINGCFQRW